MFQRSNAAFERAVALDPNRMLAASHLITNRVERGELGRAYDAATDLVRRRPQSADAHFALSYVLRYAGMLERATPAPKPVPAQVIPLARYLRCRPRWWMPTKVPRSSWCNSWTRSMST